MNAELLPSSANHHVPDAVSVASQHDFSYVLFGFVQLMGFVGLVECELIGVQERF
jgi:hypothetical protein